MSEVVKINNYDIKDLKAVRTYDSVAAMKSDTKLRVGQHVKTKGYYQSGDGGHAEYIIKSTSSSYYEELTNNLVAELIIKEPISPEMFGAYGDNEHDDTEAIQKAINLSNVLFSKSKQYIISDTITIPSNRIIDFNSSSIISNISTSSKQIFKNLDSTNGNANIEIKNGHIIGNGANNDVSDQGHAILFYNTDNCKILNMKIENSKGDCIDCRLSTNCIISDIKIGNYGRNGISPTSGKFEINNIEVYGSPFTGANPGISLDCEPNNDSESCYLHIKDSIFNRMSFADFYNTTESKITALIENINVKAEYGGVNFKSTNEITADITLRDSKIKGATNSYCIKIDNMSGIKIINNILYTDDYNTCDGIYLSGDLTDLLFKDLNLSEWTNLLKRGIFGYDGNISNSKFENVKSRIYVETNFNNNELTDCNVISFEVKTGGVALSTDNIFKNCIIPTNISEINKSYNLLNNKIINYPNQGSSKVLRIPLENPHTYLLSIGYTYQGRETHTGYKLVNVVYGSNTQSVNEIFSYGDKTITFEFDTSTDELIVTLESNYEYNLSYSIIG